jgi:hypothetical protein
VGFQPSDPIPDNWLCDDCLVSLTIALRVTVHGSVSESGAVWPLPMYMDAHIDAHEEF